MMESLRVITLATRPHYLEMAHNLALSCFLHGVKVTVMTDKKYGDPVFADEIVITPEGTGPRSSMILKEESLRHSSGNFPHAFLDADVLMLNSGENVETAANKYGFHYPAYRALPDEYRWAFREHARVIASRFGVLKTTRLPQVNGGFFCWIPGHDLAYSYDISFSEAKKWLWEKEKSNHDELVSMLALAKIGVYQELTDTCLSWWTTGSRSYDFNLLKASCVFRGKKRFPSFAHWGSTNTRPCSSCKGYKREYRQCVAVIKQKCLEKGIPESTVRFADSMILPER